MCANSPDSTEVVWISFDQSRTEYTVYFCLNCRLNTVMLQNFQKVKKCSIYGVHVHGPLFQSSTMALRRYPINVILVALVHIIMQSYDCVFSPEDVLGYSKTLISPVCRARLSSLSIGLSDIEDPIERVELRRIRVEVLISWLIKRAESSTILTCDAEIFRSCSNCLRNRFIDMLKFCALNCGLVCTSVGNDKEKCSDCFVVLCTYSTKISRFTGRIGSNYASNPLFM